MLLVHIPSAPPLVIQDIPSTTTGKTYQELFQYLVSKRASLPLGLFRLRPTDDVSPLPYVITNPKATLVLNSEDRMFTLLSPDNILSSPLGVLSITAVEAHLPPRGTQGNSGNEVDIMASQMSADGTQLEPSGTCYVVIQSQGESKTSHLCRNNIDPHWNFQAEFFVIDMEGAVEVSIHARCCWRMDACVCVRKRDREHVGLWTISCINCILSLSLSGIHLRSLPLE
jgi:hypothetical protein